MSNLAKREKIMLGILVLIIIAYLYYAFLLNPLLGKIETSKSNIKSSNEQVMKIKNAKLEIENKRNLLEALKEKLPETLKKLPEAERNPELAKNIYLLGSKNQVTLSNLTLGTPSENIQNQNGQAAAQLPGQMKLHIIPVTIAVEGTYTNTMKFINDLENKDRLAIIGSVTMTAAQDAGKLTSTLGLAYYYSNNFTGDDIKYDFNTGHYGKTDLFK